MSLRLQRVRELLKRALGEIIRRELPMQEVGLISVNDITVSPDLHHATVYIGVIGSAAQKAEAVRRLLQERKRIQGMVAKSVILKYTPVLRFQIDESVERGTRVMEILDELDNESNDESPAE